MKITTQHVVLVIRRRLYNHSLADYLCPSNSLTAASVALTLLEVFVKKDFNASKEIRAWCNSPCSDICAVCHDWMEDAREDPET